MLRYEAWTSKSKRKKKMKDQMALQWSKFKPGILFALQFLSCLTVNSVLFFSLVPLHWIDLHPSSHLRWKSGWCNFSLSHLQHSCPITSHVQSQRNIYFFLLNRLTFKGPFKFIAKLRRRYREFPLPPFLLTRIASPPLLTAHIRAARLLQLTRLHWHIIITPTP